MTTALARPEILAVLQPGMERAVLQPGMEQAVLQPGDGDVDRLWLHEGDEKY